MLFVILTSKSAFFRSLFRPGAKARLISTASFSGLKATAPSFLLHPSARLGELRYPKDRIRLTGSQINKADQEQRGEEVEEPVLAGEFACGEVEHCPGNDAEPEAVCDGVGERDEDEGEEGGNGDQGVC